jgi:hypothetical protein
MAKFKKSYNGGSLRTLLFKYSVDRSKTDPAFKSEFDAAQAEKRRLREERERAKAAARGANAGQQA